MRAVVGVHCLLAKEEAEVHDLLAAVEADEEHCLLVVKEAVKEPQKSLAVVVEVLQAYLLLAAEVALVLDLGVVVEHLRAHGFR